MAMIRHLKPDIAHRVREALTIAKPFRIGADHAEIFRAFQEQLFHQRNDAIHINPINRPPDPARGV